MLNQPVLLVNSTLWVSFIVLLILGRGGVEGLVVNPIAYNSLNICDRTFKGKLHDFRKELTMWVIGQCANVGNKSINLK